jgi:hypothetical protein
MICIYRVADFNTIGKEENGVKDEINKNDQ